MVGQHLVRVVFRASRFASIPRRWMKSTSLLFLSALFSLFPLAFGNQALAAATPDDIEPWKGWVLERHPEANCPFLFNNHTNKNCAWPGRLLIKVDSTGFSFAQSWQVYADTTVLLPGNRELWPLLETSPSALKLSEVNGRPAALLTPGTHQLRGRVNWQRRPKSIPVAAQTGLIDLWVDNQQVARPQLDRNGVLWLVSQQDQPELEAPQADSLAIRVYRKLEDDIPLRLTTRVEIEVAGRDREALFPPLLPEGFVPAAIHSSLPAKLEPSGQLRVQLRPGRWQLDVASHQPNALTELALPIPQAGQAHDDWPASEIWVVQPNPALRTLEIGGVDTIDPQQTRLPADWRQFHAYRLTADTRMQLVEKRRGDPHPAANQLKLKRQLWLDFSGNQLTVEDQISGTMNRGWRLDMRPQYRLGSATVNAEPRLITLARDATSPGIELREQQLNLQAVSRTDNGGDTHLGWEQDFDNVQMTLHLPPGWRLLTAAGVDRATSTWLGSWNLWDIFLLLIISLTAFRLLGPMVGLLAAVTVIITHGEAGSPLFSWLNLLAAMALLQVLPQGQIRAAVDRYRLLSVLVIALMILPFSVEQLRQAVYPQLEKPSQQVHPQHQQARYQAEQAPQAVASNQVRKSLSAPMERYDLLEADSGQLAAGAAITGKPERSLLNRDPDIATQTGPGVPRWQWNQHRLSWSGPVTAEQTFNLYLQPPWATSLLSFLRVILLFALLGLLAGVRINPTGLQLPKLQASSLSLLLGLLVTSALWMMPGASALADWPSPELLSEYEQRLLEQPDCLPSCAVINQTRVEIENDRLSVTLMIDSHEQIALPLPSAANNGWWIDQVRLDDDPATGVYRQGDRLTVLLPAGRQQLQLSGPLAGAEANVNFALHPHNLSLQLQGWRAVGLVNGQLRGNSLGLQRLAPAQLAPTQFTPAQKDSSRPPGGHEKSDADLATTYIPPFVRVERRLRLGLDWYLETTVTRVAPQTGAINLTIPLLAGESITSVDWPVEDGRVAVTLAPRQHSARWSSTLEKTSLLTLTASSDPRWVEAWLLDSSPIWHVEPVSTAERPALPPIKTAQTAGRWLPEWRPWPGEQLQLAFHRPEGVEGATFTIDQVALDQTAGQRQADTTLKIKLRSSKGLDYPLQLPEGARLEVVKLDGRELPISEHQTKLQLSISPGSHELEVSWNRAQDRKWLIETPTLALGTPGTNIDLSLRLPRDRWLLL
ncbi:MAG TPA: hypothetical protein DCF45_11355, partial [Gammaproteobacteria bacterium]|nr:hypothetical protein [Gammaproteobacteria bacterium]